MTVTMLTCIHVYIGIYLVDPAVHNFAYNNDGSQQINGWWFSVHSSYWTHAGNDIFEPLIIYFTKEIKPCLAEPPLDFSVGLDNFVLTSSG